MPDVVYSGSKRRGLKIGLLASAVAAFFSTLVTRAVPSWGGIEKTSEDQELGKPELSDEIIGKLAPGALRSVLLRLRSEGQLLQVADHDSHVMFGSHESHGSHGQHTSHSSSAN
jgi:hypothetical protein